MALKTLVIDDFKGGRNSKASSPVLAKNETLDQSNTWVYNKALTKRPGTVSVACAISSILNAPVKMITTNLGASGANRLVAMATFTASAYARLTYTDNGTSWANCETVPTQFAPAVIPWMGMFASYLYVSDGTNTVARYDGTNVTTVAAFPKYTKCAVHKNYIFAASGKTIYWCDLNDPTTWPANNFQTINSSGGDSVIGLRSWANGLVVFCKHSMWLLVGDVFDPIEQDYYLQKIDTPDNFTFLAEQTIVTHKGVLKFMTVDGFYAYTGGTQIIKISDPVQPDLDNITWSNVVLNGDNNLSAPRSYVWKNCMYCSFLVSSAAVYLVQDQEDKWWYWAQSSPLNGRPLDMVSCNLGSKEVLYGGNTGYSILLTMDSGNNDGTTVVASPTAVSGYWISKDFTLPNESKMLYADIYLKKQAAVATLGTLVFSISIDGATFIDFNVDMMTGVGTILKKRVPLLRMGRSIRAKVLNAELGVTFEVYQIVVTYEPTTSMR